MAGREKRAFARLQLPDDALALDDAGAQLGRVSQAGGGGMLIHTGSEKAAAQALATAADALGKFARRFGPYPWRQLRVVDAALTGGAGGLELPGVIVLASALSKTPSGPLAQLAGSPMLRDLREFAIAHEVAHQWWGQTVGSGPQPGRAEEPAGHVVRPGLGAGENQHALVVRLVQQR